MTAQEAMSEHERLMNAVNQAEQDWRAFEGQIGSAHELAAYYRWLDALCAYYQFVEGPPAPVQAVTEERP